MMVETRPTKNDRRTDRQINAFLWRFGEPHFFFACHAAFPLGLTPDLLYRLWANFSQDIDDKPLNIPWEAVADLLLSGLCSEVGYELYEMDTAVREALLDQLENNPRFGPSRIRQLASFLRDHVDRLIQQPGNRENPDIRDFAKTQRLTALVYVDPERGARTLASSLSKLVPPGNEMELIRLSATINQFSKPLAEYQPLVIYARSMADFVRGDLEDAKRQLTPILDEENKLSPIAGVNLPLPAKMREAFKTPPVRQEKPFGRRDLRERLIKTAPVNDFKDNLIQRIDAGKIIPIISNAVYNDRIFDIDDDQLIGINPGEDNPSIWSIEEQLSDAWAEEVGYPLSEARSMPQVALYDRVVNSVDDRQAKSRYLNWLKNALLILAEDDVEVGADTLEELGNSQKDWSFSDLVIKLGYPKLIKGTVDPLQILARFPLPVYVTTSYYDFMERALLYANREPRTQICFWSREPINIAPEHRTDQDYRPTIANPVVYHLLGSEYYPESMVLSEDDYLDFLIQNWRDIDSRDPIIPLYIRQSIAESSLLLLGFQLQSWEFKALFNSIIETDYASIRKFNLAVQTDLPRQLGIEEVARAKSREYIEAVYQRANIRLEWDTTQNFLQQLWQTWDRRR